MFELQRIDHIALAVRDVDASARWYCEVLGFERMHDEVWGGVPTFVGTANAALALFPAKGDANAPGDSRHGILHFAFRTDRENFERAQRELRKRDIASEFQDHQIAQSVYFRDPDGHEIEITTYDIASR